MILLLYSINQKKFFLMYPLLLTGVINRKIIDNCTNLNKQRKIVIYLSFLISISIFLIYSTYLYRIRIDEIINRWYFTFS